jgi:V/A-type H+-transporting ATPase subunit E
METELNRLIDKIKKEGVERAERDAGDILKQAETKAREIIEDARKKEAEVIEKAETQAQNFMTTSEQSLKQSARDVLLTLRERVTEFFDRIVKKKVSEQLTSDVLKDVIVKAVENFKKEGSLDIEILVSEKEKEKLKKSLLGAFSKEAKEHLTLKGARAIEKGFRIGEKGKDSYVDFTDEAIAESFKKYLNPKLVEILDIGLGMDKE